MHPAGATEDGIERQKLLCHAIIEKGDRITVDDLGRAVAAVNDLDKMRCMTQPEDMQVARYVAAGMPASEIGRLTTWHGTNFARACQPIGLINAGDPDGAVRDVRDIGRLYFAPIDAALTWAAIYVAGVAAAATPGATVESVVAAGRGAAPEAARRELDRALAIAAGHGEYAAMRAEFYRHYNGHGTHYALSQGNETVSKAFAVFAFVAGDPRRAILDSVNFGRDTDCLAATAAGLAGALTGVGDIPAAWIDQLDAATLANPYTNIACTIREHADGLHAALRRRARRLRELAALLED